VNRRDVLGGLIREYKLAAAWRSSFCTRRVRDRVTTIRKVPCLPIPVWTPVPDTMWNRLPTW